MTMAKEITSITEIFLMMNTADECGINSEEEQWFHLKSLQANRINLSKSVQALIFSTSIFSKQLL